MFGWFCYGLAVRKRGRKKLMEKKERQVLSDSAIGGHAGAFRVVIFNPIPFWQDFFRKFNSESGMGLNRRKPREQRLSR